MPTFLIQCPRHHTAVEWHSEPMKPTPPPDQVCQQCIEEKRQVPLALQRTGTHTVSRIAADSPDADYLSGVNNPEVRRVLLERRELDRQRLKLEADGADEIDSSRDLVAAYERAPIGPERRAASKRLRKVRGPRWP